MIGLDKIGALIVMVAKPFGEHIAGEHVYWILVNGTQDFYTPKAENDQASRN